MAFVVGAETKRVDFVFGVGLMAHDKRLTQTKRLFTLTNVCLEIPLLWHYKFGLYLLYDFDFVVVLYGALV